MRVVFFLAVAVGVVIACSNDEAVDAGASCPRSCEDFGLPSPGSNGCCPTGYHLTNGVDCPPPCELSCPSPCCTMRSNGSEQPSGCRESDASMDASHADVQPDSRLDVADVAFGFDVGADARDADGDADAD